MPRHRPGSSRYESRSESPTWPPMAALEERDRILHRRSPVLRRVLATIAALGLAVGLGPRTAVALDDYVLGSLADGFMPDFDQGRQPGPLVFDGQAFVPMPPGLPNNGTMYCVPTAAIDTVAYLANHGYPAALPGAPLDWQSQAQYNLVNAAIFDMGTLMETHPIDGTLGKGRSGHQEWFDLHLGPDVFKVSSKGAKLSYGPSTWELAQAGHAGQLVIMNVGWYTPQPGGQWVRTGGHQTVITGVFQNDGFFTDTCQVRLRDPGSGGVSAMTQSTFTNNLRTVQYVFGQFSDSDDPIQYYARTMVRLVGLGTGSRVGFIQAIYTVTPLHGVGSNGLLLQILNPYPVGPDPLPLLQPFTPSSGASFASLALQPITTEVLYTLRDAAGGLMPGVRRYDRVSGEDSLALPGVIAQGLTFDDGHRLFALNGACISAHDLDGSSAPAASNCASAPFDALCYDGVRDLVFAISQAQGSIRVMDLGLATVADLAIPTAVPVSGEVFLTAHPTTGDLWLRSSDSATVTCLGFDPGSPAGGGPPNLSVVESFSDPLLIGARGIECDSAGRIYWAKDGILRLHARDLAGAWAESTDSPFAGMACDGNFRLFRATENTTLEERTHPSNIHVLPDTVVGFRRGDCNGDQAFDIADAIATLSYLFSGTATPACLDACDANDDGVVNIADGIFCLAALFSAGTAPPHPFDDCDIDLTEDALDCSSYSCP